MHWQSVLRADIGYGKGVSRQADSPRSPILNVYFLHEALFEQRGDFLDDIPPEIEFADPDAPD
jgi:hypothetical protein